MDKFFAKYNNYLPTVSAVLIIASFLLFSFATSMQSDKNFEEAKNTNSIEKVTEVTETESIPFEKRTVEDPSQEYGTSTITTTGEDGIKLTTYTVEYDKLGKESSRIVKGEEITKQPIAEITSVGTKIIWHCYDATSYDKNPYNDNKCVSSTGEIRYVSDSQSRQLDPYYAPGQSGHWYYNNK